MTPAARRRQLAGRLAAARAEYATAARAGRGGRAAQARYAADIDDLVRLARRRGAARPTSAVRRLRASAATAAARCACTPTSICSSSSTGRSAPPRSASSTRSCSRSGICSSPSASTSASWRSSTPSTIGNPEFLLALCDLRLLAGDVRLFDDVLARVAPRRRGTRAAAHRGAARRSSTSGTPGSTTRSTSSSPTSRRRPAGCATSPPIRLLRIARARGVRRARPRPRASGSTRPRSSCCACGRCCTSRPAATSNVLTHDLQERVAEVLGVAGRRPAAAGRGADGRVLPPRARGRAGARLVARAWCGRPAPPTDAGSGHRAPRDRRRTACGSSTRRAPRRSRASGSRRSGRRSPTGEPVSERGAAASSRRTSAATPPTTSWRRDEARPRLRGDAPPAPGLSARLSRHARVRPARRDLPGVREDSLPRDSRLLPQVHGRRAHAAHDSQPRVAAGIRRARAARASVRSSTRSTRRSCSTLALLYHDVGKWRDDDHATESVRLAEPMLARLQLPDEDRARVEFLIRNHLAMSRVVFRRDFGDPETVAQFAALVGSEERLKMLCLMTLVDIEAVGAGHADAVEGRPALAALRRRLQPPHARLRRRADSEGPGRSRRP